MKLRLQDIESRSYDALGLCYQKMRGLLASAIMDTLLYDTADGCDNIVQIAAKKVQLFCDKQGEG